MLITFPENKRAVRSIIQLSGIQATDSVLKVCPGQALLPDRLQWKWQFPEAIIRRTEINIRKARIQEKIDLLNQELSELED